jgi:hypothetical protein
VLQHLCPLQRRLQPLPLALEELGLPREIGVASGAKATDREVPVDAHAPHVVGDSTSEPFDASDVVTPLLECLPSLDNSVVLRLGAVCG